MQNEIRTISIKGQNIYVGIDVHLRSWKVSIMLDNLYYKTISMNPNVDELVSYLTKHFPGGNYFSAYEAGFCGFSIHRKLIARGVKNIVLNPADIPTTDKEKKQKEDTRDSRKIAKSLRSGDLEGIYIPSKSTVEFRSYVRYRRTLVKEITRNKNRIKGLLYFSGMEIPQSLSSASSHWSGKFTQWLSELEFETEYGKKVLDDLIALTQGLRQNLLEINTTLRRLYNESEYSKTLELLCSVPGVGLITASTIQSEVEDINRFENLDKFCAFIGLIPSTNSSGEKDKIGNITKRSNKPLRGVLIECSWIAIRSDPSLAMAFTRLSRRMSKNKSIIRIAKKLINRIRYVLKNEAEYVCGVV